MIAWDVDASDPRREVEAGFIEFDTGVTLLRFWNATPEQAIAATLGRGMLTADDVRDLIEWHSDASGGNGRDFHNGAYVAIADELNATMGTGTCHMEPVKDYPVGECATFSFGCVCSECGAFFEYTSGSNWHYCPNCGRKVVTNG